MIINSVSAFALQVFLFGKYPEVAPVVIAEQNQNIIVNAKPFVVVILNFFVHRPHLRCFLCGLAGYIGDDFALVSDDRLHQFSRCILGHGFVPIASHSNCNDTLIIAHAFNTTSPEFLKLRFIGPIIPLTSIDPAPLIMSAHHWFVVRCGNHYAVLVGQTRVVGIVIGERRGAPHGRPQIVSLISKNEFKNFFVELVIETAEFFLRPVSQRRCFVIDKNSAILYSRCR